MSATSTTAHAGFPDEARIRRELSQFTGSENYYRSTFGRLQLTDGAHFMRERCGAFWLIDILESHTPRFVDVPFQAWTLEVNNDRSAVVEMREDDGEPALVTQRIEYTDFPLRSITLYAVDGVVLLPSEY